MKPLRALIVDDEAPARRKLIRMLMVAGAIEIAGEAAGGAEALHAIAAQHPDLVFLDIGIPDVNGLEVAARTATAQIVFVTAYQRFALRAFELHACDYLLKPYDQTRLNEVVRHARERCRTAPQRLEVDLGDRTVIIEADRLDWAQAARNYVELHTDGKTLLTRTTLEALAARVDGGGFVRVNRSVLVQKAAITEIRACGHGECRVTLRDGSEHVWTRRYRPRSSPA